MASAVLAILSWLCCTQEDAAPRPVLRGLDPVELCAGREVAGDPSITEDRNGSRYAFASEENAEAFEQDPSRFEIQLGGACGSMGPLSGPGDPDRFLVHAGRIYVFATDECRESFRAEPERYVEPEEPAPAEGAPEHARGRELLERAVEGMGGAEAIDAVARLSLANSVREPAGIREGCRYEFTGERGAGFVLQRDTVAGDHGWSEELRDTLRSGPTGAEPTTRGWAARHEFELQMSREPFFLLRQRGNVYSFGAWSAGTEEVAGAALERLVVRWNGRNTTLFVDVASGEVRRMSWYGRLGSGPNGALVVDFADFESTRFETGGALRLPRSREVTFDGRRVERLSGRLASLEVEPADQRARKR